MCGWLPIWLSVQQAVARIDGTPKYAHATAILFATLSLGLIFLLQAFLALLISSIFYPIVVSQTPWRFIDTVLLAAATFGLLYEIVADLQLSAFLQRLDNPGQRQTQVLRSGLWKYSRHPNYFGEWFFWLALSLLALSLGSWIGLVTMTLVSWLLLRFTGVARMEQRTPSLRPEYRDYQRQTPAFVPSFLNPLRLFRAASKTQAQPLLLGFMQRRGAVATTRCGRTSKKLTSIRALVLCRLHRRYGGGIPPVRGAPRGQLLFSTAEPASNTGYGRCPCFPTLMKSARLMTRTCAYSPSTAAQKRATAV